LAYCFGHLLLLIGLTTLWLVIFLVLKLLCSIMRVVHIMATFSPRDAFNLLLLFNPIFGKSLKILTVAVWGHIYVLFSAHKTLMLNLKWLRRWPKLESLPNMLPHAWARLDITNFTIWDIGRSIVIIHYLFMKFHKINHH